MQRHGPQCRLKKEGARLHSSDVQLVSNLLGPDRVFVDLSADSDEEGDEACREEPMEDGREEQASVKAQPPHGYYVKDFMTRVLRPELMQLEKTYEGILAHWSEKGLDMVASADGTAVFRWSGRADKLEIGAAKVVIPLEFTGEDLGAQQAAFWAMPILMHTGVNCADNVITSPQSLHTMHMEEMSTYIPVHGRVVCRPGDTRGTVRYTCPHV